MSHGTTIKIDKYKIVETKHGYNILRKSGRVYRLLKSFQKRKSIAPYLRSENVSDEKIAGVLRTLKEADKKAEQAAALCKRGIEVSV